MPAAAAPFLSFVWKKAISNSGYNTLSALLRLKVGDYLALEAGEELLKSVWAEGCAVCKAVTGVDLWPEMLEELPRLKQGFATYYPSMAQDVLIHQRQTEVQLRTAPSFDTAKPAAFRPRSMRL